MAAVRRYFYDPASLRRRFPEGEKRRERTEFERDLSRLKHSFSLRRLSGVTQVFQSDGRRTVRNRYSHSVEVADIAAALAAAVGPDPELVAAAALAHDLGHPPFGHHGESVLDEFARECGLDGYEGNAQTLSVLSRLEPKVFIDGEYHGLNPTRAFADATIKYPWRDGERPGPKFGVYERDLPYYDWVRDGVTGGAISVEAQVMDWADDVAYCTHDVEDGILTGMISVGDLDSSAERAAICELATTNYPQVSFADAEAAHARIMAMPSLRLLAHTPLRALELPARIKELTGELIDRFVAEVVAATSRTWGGQAIGRYDGELVVPMSLRAEAEVLKAITWRYVLLSERFHRQRGAEVELLRAVAEELFKRRPGDEDAAVMAGADPLFALLWRQAAAPRLSEIQRARAVVDAVGALTDQGLITMAAALRSE